MHNLRIVPVLLGMWLCVAPAAEAATLSAGVIFGANSEGNTYGGLTWNTVGNPPDSRGIYNLYVSTTTAPAAPVFVNGFNDTRTSIALPLAPGTVTYGLYGTSAGIGPLDGQHFALSLYFDGNTSAPGITALTGPSCALCPAGHPNGTDLLGYSGAAGANTLTWTDGALRVTVTQFTWALSTQDIVWAEWHNAVPYDQGDRRVDFIGAVTLQVEQVPEPAAAALLAMAVPMWWRRRRQR